MNTILDITTTAGAAVNAEESCIALAAFGADEEADAEVEQYMASKLLVCQALAKSCQYAPSLY